jgi:hypothetical protein
MPFTSEWQNLDYSFPLWGIPPHATEGAMKGIHWIIAAAALACAEPVQAGVNDPEVIIYRFAGVRDNADAAGTGVATSVHCTNFSGATETIRYVVRGFDATIRANVTFNIAHLATNTASTHGTILYSDAVLLNTGSVNQGSVAIAATSLNIICTAVTVDASTVAPVGFALRGIRFNPVPGSQE